MTTRIVITGAGGQVGRLLADQAVRRGYEVSALTHQQWDITDPAAAARCVAPGDVVVNCAAFTDVDAAEADPAGVYAINAEGPENIARACAQADARLIHISTDYVFAGDQCHPYDIVDTPNPVNVYGQAKYAGERAVLAVFPQACVVRTSWVYTGGNGNDFVAVMRRVAATDQIIEVVDDQIGSPTWAKDLVDALLDIVSGMISGTVNQPLVHVANAGAVSRYEQACAVLGELGADPAQIRPVPTAAAVARPARRPAYSALSMQMSVRAGLTQLRPWREALAAALAEPPGCWPSGASNTPWGGVPAQPPHSRPLPSTP